MIQTQLLKLDPPYQIISAKGLVGIQVATLIVTKEIDPDNSRLGRYLNLIEYHSYPVVNYGLKQGLDEMMKYNNNPFDDDAQWEIHRRMKPEGAVWSGVEIKNVRVLGLAGANNDYIELSYFVELIPTVSGFDPSLHIWDKFSTSRIYDLYYGLGNVGLKISKVKTDVSDTNQYYPIKLYLEKLPASDNYCVMVVVREDPNNRSNPIHDETAEFRCLVDPTNSDSINECAATIAEALHGITGFLHTFHYDISCFSRVGQYEDVIEKLKSLVEENY